MNPGGVPELFENACGGEGPGAARAFYARGLSDSSLYGGFMLLGEIQDCVLDAALLVASIEFTEKEDGRKEEEDVGGEFGTHTHEAVVRQKPEGLGLIALH